MSTRSFQPGDSYGITFVVRSSTGLLINADSLPTGSIYRGQGGSAAALDGAVTVTIANLSTGVYSVVATIPSGYAIGDRVSLLIGYSVGGTASGGFADHLRLVGYPNNALPNAAAGAAGGVLSFGTGTGQVNPTAGVVAANTTQFAGQAITATAPVTVPASIGTSTYAGTDTSGTTTLLTRLPSAITVAGGKVAATVASGDGVDAASIKTTIGLSGVGLTNLGDTRIANLDAAITTRATLTGQATALTAIQSITNNSKSINLFGPSQLPIPASGSAVYEFDIIITDPATGLLVAADATPTIAAHNPAGTSLNAALSAVTAGSSTGRYKFTYTVQSTDSVSEVIAETSATLGGNVIGTALAVLVAPTFATSFTNTDRTTLNAIATGVTVTTNNDKTGYALSVTPPTASTIATATAAAILVTPAHLLATDASGLVGTNNFPATVTVGTNNDKTGYALTSAYDPAKTAAQAAQIPANFTTALFISAGVFSSAALANAPTGGGGGSDPWATDLIAGNYTGSQAGSIVKSLYGQSVLGIVSGGSLLAASFTVTVPSGSAVVGLQGNFLKFTSGVNVEAYRQITGVTPLTATTATLQFATGFPASPTDGDAFVIS